ncbi:hypothetical protein MNBD_GAMMA02-1527 [hydrothermal vent metagenome]|uniref:Uncharacterized protein n=1 Tax=hydrothermal vent metagenome TaxID=652676 RepID=A0A3B0VPH8_9ZZZZ
MQKTIYCCIIARAQMGVNFLNITLIPSNAIIIELMPSLEFEGDNLDSD